jgi:hypothetical protein
VDAGWVFPILGTVFLALGLTFARFPARSLSFMDDWGIRVYGVSRTPGGVRALGAIFSVLGTGALVVGLLWLLGAIGMTTGT